MKLLDRNHPFYAPLWRRVAIVAVTLGWALIEFLAASPLWGTVFLVLGAYCVYEFFIAFGNGGDDEETPPE